MYFAGPIQQMAELRVPVLPAAGPERAVLLLLLPSWRAFRHSSIRGLERAKAIPIPRITSWLPRNTARPATVPAIPRKAQKSGTPGFFLTLPLGNMNDIALA